MTEDKNDGDQGDAESGEPKQERVKLTINLDELIKDMVNPVPFSTEDIGDIHIRGMTAAMQMALVERMKGADKLDDIEVARIFMGCTTTRPVAKEGRVATGHEPLTEAEVEQLTERDIEQFASIYFEKVAPADISGKQPIAALAERARAEGAKARESAKKFANEMSDLFKGSGVMSNWPDLRDALGPTARLADVMGDIQKSLSPFTDANKAIQDALNPLRGLNLGMGAVMPTGLAVDHAVVRPRNIDLLRFDPEKTPAGRAAAAASAINETAVQVAGDVAGMVKQVATMTNSLGKVAVHAEAQIKTAEQHAKSAQKMAYAAIGVALLLPVVLWFVELPDRQLQGEREGQMVELLTEQNKALSQMLDQAEANQRELRERLDAQLGREDDIKARIEALESKPNEPPSDITP